MFVKALKETFSWPVSYRMPADNGEFVTHEFKAVFKLLPQSELDALLQKARDTAIGGLNNQAAVALDSEILDQVLVGWADVQLPDGSPFVVSPENRAQLLDMPGMRSALVLAYYGTLGGQAARKN